MTGELLTYGVPLVLAIVFGSVAGGLTAWKLSHHTSASTEQELAEDNPADDNEFVNAEIDLASVAYAEAHDLPPQGAALLSARLKVLDRLGRQKGWF